MTRTTDPPATTRTRRPRLSLWLLRSLLTLHLLMVLCQPVLAGLFLTGDVDAIGLHATVGSSLAAVTMLLGGATLAYVVAGRGAVWTIPVMIAVFLAEGMQIGAGYTRNLGLHVPLGVGIVVIAVLLAAWSWTPSAARPRGVRVVRTEVPR